MDLSKIYFDSNGKKGNILQIVALEPEWAAKRIQEGEKAIARIRELEAQLAAEREKQPHECDECSTVAAFKKALVAAKDEAKHFMELARKNALDFIEVNEQLVAAQEREKELPAWFRVQGLCSMTAVADEIITLEAQLAATQKQLAAAQERERTLRDALDNMVRQFACTANGKRSTGGLSALEQAFEVLGLDDPHSLDTKEICDEPGCNAPRTCGWPSSAGYRNTCGKHYKPDPQYMNPEQEGVVERQDDKPTRR